MTRITTSQQYRTLMMFMLNNQYLAAKTRMASPTERKKAAESWKKLTAELNFIGPPTRTLSEWKKVWADYKFNLKRKLQGQNGRLMVDGQMKMLRLSPMEKTVISLLNMTDSKKMKRVNTKNNIDKRKFRSNRNQRNRLLPTDALQILPKKIDSELEISECVSEEVVHDAECKVEAILPVSVIKIEPEQLVVQEVEIIQETTSLCESNLVEETLPVTTINGPVIYNDFESRLSSVEATNEKVLTELKKITRLMEKSNRISQKCLGIKKERLKELKIQNRLKLSVKQSRRFHNTNNNNLPEILHDLAKYIQDRDK